MLKIDPKKVFLTVGHNVFVYETDTIVTRLLSAKSKNATSVRKHLKSIWALYIGQGAKVAILAQDNWLKENSKLRGQIWYVNGIPTYSRVLKSERLASTAWAQFTNQLKTTDSVPSVMELRNTLVHHNDNLNFGDDTPWKVVKGYTSKLSSMIENCDEVISNLE